MLYGIVTKEEIYFR